MKQAKNLFQVGLILLLSLTSSSFRSPPSVKNGNLKVIVTNIHSNKGQIGFSLYNSSDGFPNHPEKSVKSVFVKVNVNSAEYTFTNIEMGTYAVAVFHDENNDNKLNTNFLGIPKEGVGVSNNAKGSFGPPKFADAKFNFNVKEQTITIALDYL